MTEQRRFKQVDVFTDTPLKGNPLAVIIDADGLSDQQMQAAAHWTNLSETTFVLPPSDPEADYHLRIFCPAGELPFAGHPTLGTAHAMLENGFRPKIPGRLVQQCGVGKVTISIGDDGMLAFKAPPVTLTALNDHYYPLLGQAVGGDASVTDSPPVVVDMGIRWLMARVSSAKACLALRPNFSALSQLLQRCEANGLAIYAPHPSDGPVDLEMRAFIVEGGSLVEDPVTGSANACLARLMQAQKFVDNPALAVSYQVRQGSALGRNGRISVSFMGGDAWIAGRSITVINGSFSL